jgi:Protein of unknown function (DUF1499)
MRRWLAKISFAALVIAALVGAAAAFGTRAGFFDYRFGLFVLFPWCIYAGLVAFVLGLIWALWAMIVNRGDAARFGVTGLLGSALLIVLPLYHYAMARTLPAIHDISTDVEHPPPFVALLPLRTQGAADPHAINPPGYDGAEPAKGPEGETASTAALQKKYYPDLRQRADLMPPATLFDHAVTAAQSMGWNVVAVAPKEGRIEATATSFWFGLTDDIVIRVKPAGIGARLDIRSKSRLGQNDMGANAARIRSFMKTLSNTD